ncbi:LysR family transcriptional regulator [Massilia sp. BJB1822]|uniref:LysR family transcriptional regulator n=1 Tax=Massilia sp. BJB1822 TaxID=2744470 RepID=UPI001594492D|nr:LysR family transcriptional regulator [Massilia sp. BJB1822]NVE00914.1 LysR family transcriptional regulator [Massilia sp. BJB1822]
MINELRAMAIFAKTVETGSFRGAAKLLDLSPSVISHHISLLEERLGVALLYRSTRKLSLTHEGEELFASASKIVEAAESGLDAIAGRSREPAGALSLTMPAFFTRNALTADIAAFARRYPRIALSINFSDVKQDIIGAGFDLAIRIGQPDDSALKCRRLFAMERVLVGASALVQGRTVKQPEELSSWDWLGVKMTKNSKLLTNSKGKQVLVAYEPRVVVDSIDALGQLAVAGLGLAAAPVFLVQQELADGRLLEPLPGWQVEALDVYAVWPANAPKAGLTARLLRFLAERQSAP